jgi:DMSO/TMAO reductase YedYZ molybdopterin-dependent catalytic subunit
VEERTNEKRAKQIRRREILKLSPVVLLGAFAIPTVQDSLLKAGLAFHDWASAKLFRRNHLAPTFSDAEVVPFDKFPINGYDVADPGVDLDAWKLKVTGDVQRPGEYTLAQIQSLPRQRQNTRHICVEGWDVIGRFGGARLSGFLDLVGANPESRFVFVECADDYYTTIDMATARHSQSLLCYEMYDRPLTREHGAPVRLSIPTKIGYKNAKYLTHMHITSVLTKNGYWEDQGYSNYYGL